jgi:hypothetical protein
MIGAKTRLTVLVAGIMAVTQAATIDFTSAAAFAAATVNPNTINFNGILPSGTSFEPFKFLSTHPGHVRECYGSQFLFAG